MQRAVASLFHGVVVWTSAPFVATLRERSRVVSRTVPAHRAFAAIAADIADAKRAGVALRAG